jgi:small-conductance mechanosensitive channel
VKIPLAVFAFLGGAVAIGAGFGMQTMVKNLISGLMILFERPFRLGDLVEVGAIRGRITEIGVRASVVRDSKGVETLVPNSTFVEQNVTNWTYTSPRVRFSVAVAVAYGSPTRRVTEILAEVAGRHPLVLANPGPVAVLEDFGADAMSFVVDFWVEVRPGVEPRMVASELRHQIVEALGAAGIVMPSAQREVQLDTVRPLAVQVVPAPGTGAAG